MNFDRVRVGDIIAGHAEDYCLVIALHRHEYGNNAYLLFDDGSHGWHDLFDFSY